MPSPTEEAIKVLGSKFFYCRFIKKNGEERVGVFQIGVGRDASRPTLDPAHLIVWDTRIKEYRKIAMDRIIEIHARGKIIRRDPSGHFTWRKR